MEYKVGQKIAIRIGSMYGEPYRFGTITKVSKTQVEVDGKERYMITSGRKVGESGSWRSDSLASVSTEEAENVNAEVKRDQEHKRKVRLLGDTQNSDWFRLSDSQLDLIIAMLEDAKTSQS